jgi:hypothetical protein
LISGTSSQNAKKSRIENLSAAPLRTIVTPEGRKLTVDDAAHGELYDLNPDPTHVGAR